jgi:hypothetical protein
MNTAPLLPSFCPILGRSFEISNFISDQSYNKTPSGPHFFFYLGRISARLFTWDKSQIKMSLVLSFIEKTTDIDLTQDNGRQLALQITNLVEQMLCSQVTESAVDFQKRVHHYTLSHILEVEFCPGASIPKTEGHSLATEFVAHEGSNNPIWQMAQAHITKKLFLSNLLKSPNPIETKPVIVKEEERRLSPILKNPKAAVLEIFHEKKITWLYAITFKTFWTKYRMDLMRKTGIHSSTGVVQLKQKCHKALLHMASEDKKLIQSKIHTDRTFAYYIQ